MKRLLPTIAFLFPVLLIAGDDPLYRKEIAFSAPEVKPAALALADWLEKITGQAFTPASADAESVGKDVIVLLSAQEARAIPALSSVVAKLEPGNRKAFVIESRVDQPGLIIIGNSDTGIRHGVYRYLSALGFRSLAPGPHWQIVPRRNDIRLDLSLAESPSYLQRTFFGTGGYGPKLPLDPDFQIRKMWSDWRDANLFGESVVLPGHYGEAFIAANKAELEANPDYRAMLKGERVPMSIQFQLNYGNPGLRELYITDRLAHMGRLVSAKPDRLHAISVDPADGYGHCESPEAVALGSISDRVFGLANDVAKRMKEAFPGQFINLYAYNMHADPPAFPLESNIIVSIIPYGFNRSPVHLGDDLLVAWKGKAKNYGIYDYWALPDWGRGMPVLDHVNEVPRRLKLWNDYGVRFFNAETTTGTGAAGIALYLAGKVIWNPSTDYTGELDRFYTDAFGAARPPMQRMLERWASGFHLQPNELGLTLRDLGEALKLAESHPEVKGRVEDFITYAHYLCLLFEFDAAAADSPERRVAADNLTRYLWQIRGNAMVQTFRISQLMQNVWAKGIEGFRDEWDFANPSAPGWATVPPYPDSGEIRATMESDIKAYPVYFPERSFSKNLVPLRSDLDEGTETRQLWRMIKPHTFIFQPTRDGEVKFEVSFGNHTGKGERVEKGIVTLAESNSDERLLHNALPINGEWHPITISVRKGVSYRLGINDRAATFTLRVPGDLPVVLSGGMTPVGWTEVKNYFYVPKGTKHFGFFARDNPVADKTVVKVDESGVVEPLLSRGGFNIYEVMEGEDGKVWSVEKFTSNLTVNLFNVPNYFGFSPETVLVPKETLKKQ